MNSENYIKAVHYFGEQWPLNFWSSFTRSNVEKDFAQIKQDGFNCIILLLPMRVFMPTRNTMTKSYSERLLFLLSKSDEARLDVILRIGYPLDIAPTNTDIAPRQQLAFCLSLHQDEKTYRAYIEHLHYVKSLISKARNIRYVFTSWEDAWCVMKVIPTLDIVKRRILSKRLGFDHFVKESLPDEIAKILGVRSDRIAPIPSKEDPLFAVFKQFYDTYIYDKFISPLEQLFPNAAYEQRVDGQKVFDYKGNVQWVTFSGYGNKDVACFSYWAPFMGRDNEGEFINAKSAIKALKRVESRVRVQSNRKHFIDQFNFVNGTAQFTATAAKIIPEELPEFLGEALEYLRETTLGYGLWAYRDYRESHLVNGTFENGLYNWTTTGRAKIIGDGPYWLAVQGDCELKTQTFVGRSFSKFEEYYGPFQLTFCIEVDRQGPTESPFDQVKITASIFGDVYPVNLVKDVSCQSVLMDFDYKDKGESTTELSIRISTPKGVILRVRDFQFYNHVLSNGLYTFDNESSPSIDVIRKFNTTT